MSDRSRKIAKPAAALGVLATMASIWGFPLRPRRKPKPHQKPTRPTNPPRPLRSRNFALIWSAALVSNVGTWMQTVALGILVFARTGQPAWTGLVAAAGFLPIGVLAPLGGAMADRLDRRRWLMVTTLAEMTFAALLAALASVGDDPPGVLVLFSFLGGASGAIGFPAYQAMVPDLVPPEDLLGAV